ncbi:MULTISPECIES: DUF6434 domain-containing protein [Rhizobium]|uniref:DUF6434 domain-containing protein n=1 Tax=Rhizobium rhododendri TaxID=2506430 RepID=A0ABY8IES5_9HYPH|nr:MULTISPECIES: DUF6434 domain-containing protein [Rhizobium]TQX84998.1 hypothetical protein EQW76_22960 [Rhizobium sp. rho-13.1]TQY09141.1 hypothetical protein EQW74_22160 [Rhizobium sp. rho-1.1]WFS22107.1 DUF6434 domain-containing protein [Rhizobium rhododendri]
MAFDWHSSEITRATPLTASYRNRRNVRRFFQAECGEGFRFDRPFMGWLKTAVGQTMGSAADEWCRREAAKRQPASPAATDA